MQSNFQFQEYTIKTQQVMAGELLHCLHGSQATSVTNQRQLLQRNLGLNRAVKLPTGFLSYQCPFKSQATLYILKQQDQLRLFSKIIIKENVALCKSTFFFLPALIVSTFYTWFSYNNPANYSCFAFCFVLKLFIYL